MRTLGLLKSSAFELRPPKAAKNDDLELVSGFRFSDRDNHSVPLVTDLRKPPNAQRSFSLECDAGLGSRPPSQASHCVDGRVE